MPTDSPKILLHYRTEDVKVHVSTVEEATEVLKAWGKAPGLVVEGRAASSSSRPPSETDALIRSFLGALAAHPEGVTSGDLADAMGLVNTKALSRTMISVRRRVAELGGDFDQVASRHRSGNKSYWVQGTGAADLLLALGPAL